MALVIGTLYWVTSTEDKEKESETRPGKILDALVLIKKSYSFPDLRFVSFAAFFLFLAYIGLMTFTADHLKVSFSLPSDQIGLILSTTGFLGIGSSFIAGILGDRLGRKPVSYAGMMIMVASILGLRAVDYTYGKYIAIFALFGTGSATAWASLNTLAVQAVPDLRKPATSVYSSFKFTGYALAPLALSFLYLPFSMPAVHWACIVCILLSLFFTSRMSRQIG